MTHEHSDTSDVTIDDGSKDALTHAHDIGRQSERKGRDGAGAPALRARTSVPEEGLIRRRGKGKGREWLLPNRSSLYGVGGTAYRVRVGQQWCRLWGVVLIVRSSRRSMRRQLCSASEVGRRSSKWKC